MATLETIVMNLLREKTQEETAEVERVFNFCKKYCCSVINSLIQVQLCYNIALVNNAKSKMQLHFLLLHHHFYMHHWKRAGQTVKLTLIRNVLLIFCPYSGFTSSIYNVSFIVLLHPLIKNYLMQIQWN